MGLRDGGAKLMMYHVSQHLIDNAANEHWRSIWQARQERESAERLERFDASRPKPFVPRTAWGEFWHAFNWAWHYDRTGDGQRRDYWLRQIADMARQRQEVQS